MPEASVKLRNNNAAPERQMRRSCQYPYRYRYANGSSCCTGNVTVMVVPTPSSLDRSSVA